MPGTSSVWSSPVSLKVGDKTIIKKNVEDKMERIFFFYQIIFLSICYQYLIVLQGFVIVMMGNKKSLQVAP